MDHSHTRRSGAASAGNLMLTVFALLLLIAVFGYIVWRDWTALAPMTLPQPAPTARIVVPGALPQPAPAPAPIEFVAPAELPLPQPAPAPAAEAQPAAPAEPAPAIVPMHSSNTCPAGQVFYPRTGCHTPGSGGAMPGAVGAK